MKRLALAFSLAMFALGAPLAASAQSAGAMSAMPACAAGDPVVWVNTKTKVYHLKGDAYFGKTKSGMYACKSAAVARGAHASGAMKKDASSSMSGMKGCDMSSMSESTTTTKKKHHKKSDAMASPAPAAT